ncbi:hypothetical protein SUGI_0297240 [Cryptomeria japonica]|nr:hypothetical protein SUGI_0297240 [Cryptomeria japonica]
MGVEIVGSEYIKDQPISKLVTIDEEKTIKLEANDMKAFSGFEAAEAPTSANESLNVQDQKQATAIDNGIPIDVKVEWPAPAEVHQLYMVKFRSYDDPQLKSKLDQADRDLQKKSQAHYQITEAAKIQDFMGEKELIQDHFKVLGEDLDALRKEQQGAWSRIKPFEEDLRVIG